MSEDADQFQAALAVRVRAHRIERGWSMEELASSAGLHRTSLGLVERGARGLSVAAAYSLAHALGLALSTLVAEVEADLAGSPGP